jgi:hypothetical protein
MSDSDRTDVRIEAEVKLNELMIAKTAKEVWSIFGS